MGDWVKAHVDMAVTHRTHTDVFCYSSMCMCSVHSRVYASFGMFFVGVATPPLFSWHPMFVLCLYHIEADAVAALRTDAGRRERFIAMRIATDSAWYVPGDLRGMVDSPVCILVFR